MRTKMLLSILVTSLTMSACSKERPAQTIPPPPPPQFEAATTEPEPTATPASEERRTSIAPDDQVLFAFDSAELEPAAMKVLDDVAVWVKADPARAVVLKGHADATGPISHNFALSSSRAETVAGYLTFRGVPREQIAVIAVGEADAVIEPADANRRVIIYGMAPAEPTASR